MPRLGAGGLTGERLDGTLAAMGPDPYYPQPNPDAQLVANVEAALGSIKAQTITLLKMGFTLDELVVLAPDYRCQCAECKGGPQVVLRTMARL